MADADSLRLAWHDAQAALPDGWLLDSLRCAATGLDVASRSEEWIAVAVAPDGSERTHQAPDPVSALLGLAGAISSN